MIFIKKDTPETIKTGVTVQDGVTSSSEVSTQTIPQRGDGVNINDTQDSTNGGVDVGAVSQTVDEHIKALHEAPKQKNSRKNRDHPIAKYEGQ